MNPSPKSIFRSKTFWLNLAPIVAALYPPAAAWLAANPVTAVMALGAANTLLRFATNGKVFLLPASGGDDSPESGISESRESKGRTFQAWALAAGLAGSFGFFSLPACSPQTATAPVTIPPVPIHATWHKGGTTVSYDSAGGITVDQDSGK